MDMPKPGVAHEKLAALIGDWSGGETLYPSPWDPNGGSATARVVNRWVVDGFAVVQEYEQRRGGDVTFRGHGVFWFDAVNDQYVMHWWDSMGGAGGEYRGGFVDSVLTLGAAMPQGGQSRTSFDLTRPGAYAFTMEISPDGVNWLPAMTGTYTNQSAEAPAAPSAKSAAKRATPRVGKKSISKKTVSKTTVARTAARAATTGARPAKKTVAKLAKKASRPAKKAVAMKPARTIAKAGNARRRR